MRPQAVNDIYPDAKQLGKGEYVIRACLRHDDAALLDKLKVGLAGEIKRRVGALLLFAFAAKLGRA